MEHVLSMGASLASIELPDALESIGRDALHGCTSLNLVCLSESIYDQAKVATSRSNEVFSFYCSNDSSSLSAAEDRGKSNHNLF